MPSGDDVEAGALQRIRQRPCVLHDVPGIDLEIGPKSLAEGDCLGGNHMHQRPALQAGKHCRVDLLCDLLVVGQDQSSTRTAQRLMRRGCHDMRMRNRRGMHATGHQSREMRHIDHEVGADVIGDLAGSGQNPRFANRPFRRR